MLVREVAGARIGSKILSVFCIKGGEGGREGGQWSSEGVKGKQKLGKKGFGRGKGEGEQSEGRGGEEWGGRNSKEGF